MIVVVGDIILDTEINGMFKSSNENIPVVNVENTRNFLGAAANVAKNIKSLGSDVYLFGSVGDDENGKIIRRKLHSRCIPYRLTTESMTTQKVRINNMLRLDFEYYENIQNLNIIDTLEKLDPELIVISDYGKGYVNQDLVTNIMGLEKKVIVDPKHLDYSGAYIITPTKQELLELTNETNFLYAANKLSESIDYVAITKGNEGIELFHSGSSRYYPTEKHDVCDAVGAGDVVVSVLATLLQQGKCVDYAIRKANKAASKSCLYKGQYDIKKEDIK